MGYIHEPVTEWEITVTEFVHIQDFSGRQFLNEHHFKTVSGLKEYFERPRSYPVAISLSYNIPRPPAEKYNPNVIGRLSFYYEDRFSKPIFEFDSVHDFVRFLEAHEPLAKCVEYVKKKK